LHIFCLSASAPRWAVPRRRGVGLTGDLLSALSLILVALVARRC